MLSQTKIHFTVSGDPQTRVTKTTSVLKPDSD